MVLGVGVHGANLNHDGSGRLRADRQLFPALHEDEHGSKERRGRTGTGSKIFN
jgi:hypothetical protein